MKAIFPGSFDPITNGHLALIKRAAAVFDEVVVVVANNQSKHQLFNEQERLALVAAAVKSLSNVTALRPRRQELTVQVAQRVGAQVIIRGVRNETDFSFEQAIAAVNKDLAPDVETLLLPSQGKYQQLSSTLVREIASYGGDVSTLVPPAVQAALLKQEDRIGD
ncbi:MAG: pantetheine-phosphate adenylyltransferase [Lactobacillus sp.]|nr:pantetheine-phosphate adenylyltransferase [Lactobacillus sp.]MCH3906615.1 pantetheine-phosphate adenylyltransferase [Lactobacillus sp.]MCH3989749.1 pantetheine-phosphate adenylyltransferase [Lactobacillus sp.]MCH4068085.1 pantetheine-phosphate adenylyltransferase [Lactobacillus sp.]MCI1303959.1 pantetheine-phosphate adenylyltransferase [Lactobacillus sp.]